VPEIWTVLVKSGSLTEGSIRRLRHANEGSSVLAPDSLGNVG
jgi:hypothetical protein